MRRLMLIGLVAGSLTACGDDGGSGGESSGSTGAGTTTTDPTVDPTATGSTSAAGSTTESTLSGSSTTSDETTTTDAESSSSTAADESSSSSGDPAAFELTSPAFEQDGMFPVSMHSQGGNVHPQLDWVGTPAAAMSLGVFFRDLDFAPGGDPFQHSAIWNIAADENQLPEGLEMVAMPGTPAGAQQCRSWQGQFGYGGPGSPSNTYEFTLYALDVADLSGEIDSDSSLIEVQMALEAHAIETTTLSGQTVSP